MQSLAYLTSSLTEIVPMAQEFYLFTFFCLGFIIFRTEALQRLLRGGRQEKARANAVGLHSMSRLRDDFAHRRYEQVLDGWAFLETYTPEALSLVVTALMALGRPDDIGLFIAKTVTNLQHLKSSLYQVVSAVANPSCDVRRQHIAAALRDIHDQARHYFDVSAITQMVVALASHNDEQRVSGLLGELAAQKAPATFELLGKVVHGFLLSKNLDAALGYLPQALTVCAPGERSPCELIVEVVKASTEADISDNSTSENTRPRAWDALDTLESCEVPSEAALLFLEWSSRQTPVDVPMATRVELMLRKKQPFPAVAHDALVRVHAKSAGDQAKAFASFDEYVSKEGVFPSETSLVGMISSCVEARNGSLAEYMFKWAHTHGRCTAAIFSATVKVLAASKQAERICAIYDAVMPDAQLALDEAIYAQMINSAVQIGRSELAHSLSHCVKTPNVQNYMALMRARGQEGKVDEVLALLRELQQKGAGDIVTCNCALDICVTAGDGSAANKLFKEMETSGRIDVVSYNIMLKLCMSEGSSSVAREEVLKSMQAHGFKPNTATFNSLIGSALSEGNFSKAWQTIDHMESVDAYTLSILFKGYKNERRTMDPESIDRALALISKHSVKVDEVLINVALEACFALHDMTRMKNALAIFKRSGWVITKQCANHTYGVLIKAYGQIQNLGEAWRLWNEVTVEKRREASEQLYGQMLDVLVGNNCLEESLTLFEQMKVAHKSTLNSQGFSVAYAMIIRGFAHRKDVNRALQCYEEMKVHGTKVSLVVLNTLIDACSRAGDMAAAAKLFQEMQTLQCEPDLITYSTLIKGYCMSDDLDKALQFFSVMQKKGIRPDAIVFNSLLDGCAKKQMPALCEQVIQDMESASVVPSNHSASILIKLYGRCKDLDAAFRVINDMPQKYGFKANNAVYTCLMSACIANGHLDKAMELRLRMQKERIMPDEKTYSTLLRGTLRAGSVEQCALLVNSALDQQCRRSARYFLDEELVKSVLLLIQRRNLWEAHGRELLERLQNSGISVRCPEPAKPFGRNDGTHENSRVQRSGNFVNSSQNRNNGCNRDSCHDARSQQHRRGAGAPSGAGAPRTVH